MDPKELLIFIPCHTIVTGYYGFTLVSIICQSVVCSSVFSFPNDNLSKFWWIYIELGMCIDIIGIWFGIANGQISFIFDSVIFP